MNIKSTKLCVVCNKKFDCNTETGKCRQRNRSRRAHDSYTCSKKCSKIYNRINVITRQKFVYRFKKLNELLKQNGIESPKFKKTFSFNKIANVIDI